MPDQNIQYVAVATGTTNTTPGSTVIVEIADMTLVWEIQDNAFGDKLPVIPSRSRVEHGKILYRLKIKAILRSRSSAGPVSGHAITIKSNRAEDSVSVSPGTTGSDGSVMVTLETRKPGALELSVNDHHVTAAPLQIALAEAWYESGFQVTHYIIADENDFAASPRVSGAGLNEQHPDGFLYGAGGVPMQGTGQTKDGQYVHFDGGGGGWHYTQSHAPDRLNDPDSARFSYQPNAGGRFAIVQPAHSIAVDPHVIPGRTRVYIESQDGQRVVGNRVADDTGGGIRGYHVDHFSGLGRAATRHWQQAGGDLTNARVKFLGE